MYLLKLDFVPNLLPLIIAIIPTPDLRTTGTKPESRPKNNSATADQMPEAGQILANSTPSI